MSAKDFRELFNNPAFVSFYKKEISGNPTDSTSFLGIGREGSKSFVRKTVGDFILSREQLTSMLGANVASKLISSIKSDISHSDVASYRNIAGQEQIIFPEIKFSNATKEITKLLNEVGSGVGIKNIANNLELYFDNNPQDIGHIFGFSNTLLTRTKSAARTSLLANAQSKLKSANYIGEATGIKEAEIYLKDTLTQLNALDEFIDAMVGVLEEYDMASSPIKGLDLGINAKYRKTASNWAFTFEGSAEQQLVGSKLATILGNIKQSKVGGSGARGLFSSLQTASSKAVADKVLENFVQEFLDKSISAPDSSALNLLRQKSSPSLIDLISSSIAQAFGVKNPYKKEYLGAVKLPSIPLINIKKPTNTKSNLAEIKNTKLKVSKVKKEAEKQLSDVKRMSIAYVGNTDLTSLQTLLDAQLQHVVSANMGNGNDRRLLNYRTGRLAASAKVERLTMSREGMITAFYSYMKNPYATFSEGGMQQFPKTRDPKLLISKSIREIAATKVGNRLRAVVV